jgi:hypothetical protein
MRRPLALLPLVFSVIASACGRGSAAELTNTSRIPGHYAYVARGSTVTVPWDLKADLVLWKDSTYTLTMDLLVKDDKNHEVGTGRYEVTGDRVVLLSLRSKHAHGHSLLVRGDSLDAELGWKVRSVLQLVGVPRPVLVRVKD